MRTKLFTKKLVVFNLTLLCLLNTIFGTSVDSLKQSLANNSTAKERVDLLVELAQTYLNQNVDSTAKYAQLALLESKLINYPAGLLKAYNQLGNCAQRKGDLDSAIALYNQVKQIAIEEQDDKGMAIVLNNIGIVHTNRGSYKKALDAYLEAIKYEKSLNDSVGIAEGYNNVGVVHYYMGDMENTLVYLKKSTDITKAIGDQQILKKGYINIGAIHQYNKEYSEALGYYRNALEIAKKLNDQNDIFVCLHNIAQIYTSQGRFEEARANYERCIEFYKKFDNSRGVAMEYINLANLYKKQKNYLEADSYFQKAVAIATERGFLKVMETAYSGLSEVNASLNNFKKSNEYLHLYIEIKDSLLNENNAKSFAELRTKYETAEKEKLLAIEKSRTDSLKIKNAKVEQDRVEANLRLSNRNNWIIGLLSLVVVAILVFWNIMQRNKRKAQAEKDAALISERDKGTKAVINAQEDERKRISKDLHDGVGQQLSGLKMAFQKLQNELRSEVPEKAEALDQLTSIIDDSANDVRTISHQMMPRVLLELGITEAIADMLEKALKPSGIKYEFDHYGFTERLDENIEVGVYRIVQELINNILKHSNAKKVQVQLFINNSKLILIVEDNGKGFNSSDTAGGHGLLNIKSRLSTVNGEVHYEPSPASGTTATIRIPLKNRT